MEIVIKISEDDYKLACEYPDVLFGAYAHAIKNGTPLPKGHGRLFILDEEKAKEFFTKFSFSLQNWISEVGISNAIIKVIEADK